MNNNCSIKFSVTIITNLTVSPYFPMYLYKFFNNTQPDIQFNLLPYHNILLSSSQKTLENSDMIIIWLNFKYLYLDYPNNIYSGKVTSSELVSQSENEIYNLIDLIRNIESENDYLTRFNFSIEAIKNCGSYNFLLVNQNDEKTAIEIDQIVNVWNLYHNKYKILNDFYQMLYPLENTL